MTSKKASSTPRKKAGKKATKKGSAQKSIRAVKGKYDWEKAKSIFVEGEPSDPNQPDGDRDWMNMRELSDYLGIPYQRIRETAAKQRWTEFRTQHRAEMARERQRKRSETLVDKAIVFDDDALRAANMSIRLVRAGLAEMFQEVEVRTPIRQKALNDLKAGLPVEPNLLWSGVRSERLSQLVKSLEIAQSVGMRALGTDVDKHILTADLNIQAETTVSVQEELLRDDPDRLAALMAAMDRSGVMARIQATRINNEEEDEDGETDAERVVSGDSEDGGEAPDIVDGEIVD